MPMYFFPLVSADTLKMRVKYGREYCLLGIKVVELHAYQRSHVQELLASQRSRDRKSRSLLASQRSQVQELACLLEVARAGALAGGAGRGARPADAEGAIGKRITARVPGSQRVGAGGRRVQNSNFEWLGMCGRKTGCSMCVYSWVGGWTMCGYNCV